MTKRAPTGPDQAGTLSSFVTRNVISLHRKTKMTTQWRARRAIGESEEGRFTREGRLGFGPPQSFGARGGTLARGGFDERFTRSRR
ncbi:hypothetical protein SAMN05192563_103850 [Paraburkholderia aspalathi]|uniref:Uncharacterized protein n=1 Tax=Paraburkholderia aspalathi TaxID=1324617 RepID=A0A1I7ENR9_9BURK|nr:hypothetical protein SAMN05192563_103850 [Paraburkholderia aspalathi]